MSLLIMKLAIEATSSTSVNPEATRFFTIVTGNVAGGTTLTIDTAQFFDDTGHTPAALPALIPANSTTKLYINGVLQMDGIYAYTSGAAGKGSLVITIPESGSILDGSPVVLEIVNYAPASSTDIVT